MNFLADENTPRQIIERLRREGHQIISIAELTPGISDENVLEIANRDGAILITADTDFGELIFRQSRASVGVILTRLGELSPAQRAEVISSVIKTHQNELKRAFTVIAPGRVRIRRSI